MIEKIRESEKDGNYIDLHKIISQCLDNWKLFLISTIICFSISLFFIWYSTPLYKVHAQVLIQDNKSNSNSMSFLENSQMQQFGNLFGIQSNVNDELGILQTRDLTEKIVRNLNLNVITYSDNEIKSRELYDNSPFVLKFISRGDSVPSSTISIKINKDYSSFSLASNDINLNNANGKFGDTINSSIGKLIFSKSGLPFQGDSYSVLITSVDAQVAILSQQLTTIINDQSNIISLTLNTNIPQKGQDILNSLIDAYIERNLNEKNKISDSILAFIQSRVKIVSGDLNNIEANIQGFKQKNKLANIDEQSKALVDNSSSYYNKLNDIDIQLNIINTMLSGVKQDTNKPVPVLINTDPGFITLVQKYNALITQRDRILLTTTNINPLAKNVTAQIEATRANMINSLQDQQRALQISRKNVIDQNSQINNMVNTVPAQERQYVNLSRERDVKQELYLFLLQQEETTAITKASNIPSASVIAVPKTEYEPYFPSKLLTLALGILAGLGLPSAFIFFKQALNKKIQSREDITDNTDCSILAEIGHNEAIKGILQEQHSRSILAEQFRIFRTNMDFLVARKKCSKILLTSTMSGEGKSFISLNVAQVYAYSGKKVLLMEMDLRKPKLSSMLNMENVKGFSNYMLSNEDDIENYIKVTRQNKNISILSSGPIPPNPAELLLSEKVSKMFSILENKFDIIIIDSPPITAVADAQILTRFSNINLYVIRQSYSFKNSIKILNDLLNNGKLSNFYVVLNDVKKNTSYKYGYGYGYGYGYTTEEKKNLNGKTLSSWK